MVASIFVNAFGVFLVLGTCFGTFQLLFLTTLFWLSKLPCFYKKEDQDNQVTKSLSLVVIIPAHNEALSIQKTIQSLLDSPGYKEIVVVADHCTDETGYRASLLGVRVLERNSGKRGKPAALMEAFSLLLKEKKDLFVVVDADTVVDKNFIEEIQKAHLKGAEVLQVRDELEAVSSMKYRLFEISFRAFNTIRPKARAFAGLSCGILGNGFSVTRKVLKKVPFTDFGVVEDLVYHLHLVKAGFFVHFLTTTAVTSKLPLTKKGLEVQRLRWEGGRIFAFFKNGPFLLKQLFKGQLACFEPLLDLALPPLSYFAFLLSLLCFLPSPFPLFGFFGLAVLLFHLLTAICIGKDPLKESLALFLSPFYLFWKLSLLGKLCKKMKAKEEVWEKTPRDNKE